MATKKKSANPEAMLDRLLKMAETLASAQAKREERQTRAFERGADALAIIALAVEDRNARDNVAIARVARATSRARRRPPTRKAPEAK